MWETGISWQVIKFQNPLVIAHRGSSGYLAEHTLASVALADGLGADFIELDLILTQDNQPVVLHNFTLDDKKNLNILFRGQIITNSDDYCSVLLSN